MKRKIFAAILAVVMVMSMLPMSVMADSVETTTKYSADVTMSAPMIVKANETVTLTADTPVTITADDVVDAFRAENGGTLILGANITIISNTSILYANGGKIVVDGAKLVANSAKDKYNAVTVENKGSLEVTAGSIEQSGTANTTITVKGEESTVAISGGKVTSEHSSALRVSNSAVATISGGTVETTCLDPNYCAAYATGGGKIVVTNGTVKAEAGRALVACKYTDTYGGIIEMSGGTAIGGIMAWEDSLSHIIMTGGYVEGGAAVEDGAWLDVYGGRITGDITEGDRSHVYVASANVTFDANGGKFADPSDAKKEIVLVAGQACPKLPVVTREGYTFNGWCIYYTVGDQRKAMYLETNSPVNIDPEMFEAEVEIFDAVAAWTKKSEPEFETFSLPNLRSIVIDTTEGGKTGVSSGKAYGALGSTYRLTLKPEEGYAVDEALVNGKAVEVSKNNKISFVVKGNTYVEVSFAKIED